MYPQNFPPFRRRTDAGRLLQPIDTAARLADSFRIHAGAGKLVADLEFRLVTARRKALHALLAEKIQIIFTADQRADIPLFVGNPDISPAPDRRGKIPKGRPVPKNTAALRPKRARATAFRSASRRTKRRGSPPPRRRRPPQTGRRKSRPKAASPPSPPLTRQAAGRAANCTPESVNADPPAAQYQTFPSALTRQ